MSGCQEVCRTRERCSSITTQQRRTLQTWSSHSKIDAAGFIDCRGFRTNHCETNCGFAVSPNGV